MTSIFLKSGGLLDYVFNHGRTAPLVVFSRGMFNCLSPRVSQLQSKDYYEATSHLSFIASNADTYHLSREVIISVREQRHEPCAATCLSKLTQVRQLSLGCYVVWVTFLENHLCPMIERLAPTLEELYLSSYAYYDRKTASTATAVAAVIAPLRNLRVLRLPEVIGETCNAIAAGPGHRLRELVVEDVACSVHDLEALVAACPEILHLQLGSDSHSAGSLPALSKLRYLQNLCSSIAPLFCRGELKELPLNTVQERMCEWHCLTHLQLYESDDVRFPFTADMAMAIATTVGPQLRVFHLGVAEIPPGALAAICNAVSFPVLEELDVYTSSFLQQEIDDQMTVSLSPQLHRFNLPHVQLSPRLLTQLLDNKPKLEYLDVAVKDVKLSASRRRSRRNDDDSVTESDQDDHDAPADLDSKTDWLGKLVQCPLRELRLGACLKKGVSQPERVGRLSATLSTVKLDFRGVYHHPRNYCDALARDLFIAAFCSKCVLLECILVSSKSRDDEYMCPINTTVAFAGLRNNERLRRIFASHLGHYGACAIYGELMSMKSLALNSVFVSEVLDIYYCERLAERFMYLNAVAYVRKEAVEELSRRYPRVDWQCFRV